MAITCVPGCTSATEVILALDCNDLTGAPSAVLTGFRAFWSATMDLSSLSAGVMYKVCVDVDGTAVSTMPVGDTGLMVKTAGPISIDAVSIEAVASTRLPLLCTGCTTSTSVYLVDPGTGCTAGDAGTHAGVALTSSSSVQLTGAGTRWDAYLDASILTGGSDYELCMDLDGASRSVAFTSTGLLVQTTSISGIVNPTFHVDGNTELQLSTSLSDGSLPTAYAYVGAECSTAFSGSTGERTAVEQTVLGVVSGVISFPLAVAGLDQGKIYRACIDEDGPGVQGFVDAGPLYATGVTSLTPSGLARATNQQITVTCFGVCSTDSMMYLTLSSCNTAITNGDAGVPTGEDAASQTAATALVFAGPGVNIWTWTIDATNLSPGRQFRVCADVDGAAGTKPFGDTGSMIYTSPFSEVLTKGINVATLQTVNVRCATGCSESTRVYLALRSITPSNLYVKVCDSTVNDGVMRSNGNENTGSVTLVHKSGDLWAVENIDASALIAGRYYGLCTDVDGPVANLAFGDTGFMVYVSGLEAISPQAIRQAFAQEIQLTCPYCNPNNDITQAYIALECDTSLYFGFNLPATASVNSPTNRLPGPAGVTDPDATKLYIDARTLDLGGVYHLCVDLDGSNAKMAMGDTSFVVYVTAMTSLKPWGILPAANQTVVMTCSSGCVTGVSVAYVGTDCDYTVSNGEMTALAGTRTPHASFNKPADLATDDYQAAESHRESSATESPVIGTDLDGSGSLPWGNSDLPVYASPVTKASRPCASCAAALVWIIGAFEPCETWYYAFYSSTTSEHLGCIGRTSAVWSFVRPMKPLVFLARVRLSCELCTVETRLYLIDEQNLCDFADFAGQKTGSADQHTWLSLGLGSSLRAIGQSARAASVGVSPFGDNTGLCLSIVVGFLDTTALTTGLRFRVCIDLDGVATDYAFGDVGFQVYMAAVTASGGTISPASGQEITMTCASGCSTDTMAYLAITCDSTITDGVIVANGILNSAAVNLVGASPDWTATIDASSLQPGRHYRLCTDLDGATGTMPMGSNDFLWYVSGVSGLPHYKFGLKQQQGVLRATGQVVRLVCADCTNTSAVYLGLTCLARCEMWAGARVRHLYVT
ncbi:unnamed protein product [Effrenium voratum]|nr:unnamed protein product [Effrenium voratum]